MGCLVYFLDSIWKKFCSLIIFCLGQLVPHLILGHLLRTKDKELLVLQQPWVWPQLLSLPIKPYPNKWSLSSWRQPINLSPYDILSLKTTFYMLVNHLIISATITHQITISAHKHWLWPSRKKIRTLLSQSLDAGPISCTKRNESGIDSTCVQHHD